MTAVSVAVPFAKVPLAPEVGAANFTVSPAVAIAAVVTVTVKGAGNILPLAALCGVPLVVVIATTCGEYVTGAELELPLPPQPVRTPRGSQMNAKMTAQALRFIASFPFGVYAQDGFGEQTIP